MSEEKDEKVATLNISVRLPHGAPLSLKVKKDTKMEKIFTAVAKQMGVDKSAIRFAFDGKIIQGENTPKMLEMEDEDQIDCMMEQVGGF